MRSELSETTTTTDNGSNLMRFRKLLRKLFVVLSLSLGMYEAATHRYMRICNLPLMLLLWSVLELYDGTTP